MRQRMIRLWQVEARPTFPDYDAALLDKCSLTELKTIADSDRPLRHEALRRWARLDPKGATPWLVGRVNDPRREVNRRFDAAFALAQIGDRRGVDWLKGACVNNIGLGGSPGAALLESGAAGAAAFFQLVDEHSRRQPDTALPYALAEGAGCFSTETLFKHLSRLLKLKDEKTHHRVRGAVAGARLSADQLAFLIDHLRKGKYQDEALCDSLRTSLSSKASPMITLARRPGCGSMNCTNPRHNGSGNWGRGFIWRRAWGRANWRRRGPGGTRSSPSPSRRKSSPRQGARKTPSCSGKRRTRRVTRSRATGMRGPPRAGCRLCG
jgi:hypothetical protein